jgi:hypothetical protein
MTWDKTKPSASGYLVSGEIRQQWDALEKALFGVNLMADPTFLIWQAGDSAAPAHYVLAGAGATIARCGTGLGDTNRKVGKFCAKVTGSGATATLTQQLLTTTTYDDHLDALTISYGAWVRCVSGSSAKLVIDDGAATTSSAFHTGSSTWEWLTVSRSLSASATKLAAQLSVVSGVSAHFSGPTMTVGEVAPGYYVSAPVTYGTIFLPSGGTLSGGANRGRFVLARPGIIKDVQLYAETAPSGTVVDVNTWDGSAWTTIFATPITLATKSGGKQPDGTYARRCITGHYGTGTIVAGGAVNFDIDSVGGTPGADLGVQIRVMQYARPFETFLGYNE